MSASPPGIRPPQGGRPTVMSRDGMVASAHPLASQCGARILGRGGNAFDAAVAVAAALAVVEPFMSGLAGMGFATLWSAADRRMRVLDFVPPVPASFPAERFRSRQELARGPLSVGLPGALAGWCELVERLGTRPLAELVEPAAHLAERGFALSEYGAWEISHQAPSLMQEAALFPGWLRHYPFPEGARLGQVLRQPDLATTLRGVGAMGRSALYGGALGKEVVRHLAALGGCLTLEDLAGTRALWREPVSARYRGLTVHLPPPPCEGFQILLALRILDGFDLAGLDQGGAGHPDLVIRAIRLAAGERIRHNNPEPGVLRSLLSDEKVMALRDALRRGEGLCGPVEQWMEEPAATRDFAHTTSFSVADAAGNVICMTQSLGTAFGSGVAVPGTGIALNNSLHWADVQAGSPNRSGPGDPLPMCMAPSLSTQDGEVVLALGTPGGYGILQTQVQAMVQHLDFGLPLQQAVEAPRLRLWDGDRVEVECRIPGGVVTGLRALGHDAAVLEDGWSMLVGGMQAIRLDPVTGILTGAADPRRDGYAIGV